MDAFPFRMQRGLRHTLMSQAFNTPKAYRAIWGAVVKRVTQGDWEHFFLATYWQDMNAVKAFAGEDYHVAVTYPDDEQFGLLPDPYVLQHDVESVQPL